MEYYPAEAIQQMQQDYLLNLFVSPESGALNDHNGTAYHRFLEVLPDEAIQGFALACQNQVNILSRQGDKAAAAIPYRSLNDDRPKVLAKTLYNELGQSGHFVFQRGQYVIRIMEAAFLDLALCSTPQY